MAHDAVFAQAGYLVFLHGNADGTRVVCIREDFLHLRVPPGIVLLFVAGF